MLPNFPQNRCGKILVKLVVSVNPNVLVVGAYVSNPRYNDNTGSNEVVEIGLKSRKEWPI